MKFHFLSYAPYHYGFTPMTANRSTASPRGYPTCRPCCRRSTRQGPWTTCCTLPWPPPKIFGTGCWTTWPPIRWWATPRPPWCLSTSRATTGPCRRSGGPGSRRSTCRSVSAARTRAAVPRAAAKAAERTPGARRSRRRSPVPGPGRRCPGR